MDRSACSGTKHGNEAAYNHWGCRCPDARADLVQRNHERNLYLPKRVPAHGSIRRLRALFALGWGWTELHVLAGIPLSTLKHVATSDLDRTITRVLRDEIHAAYDGLSGTPGPSARARRQAKANGWKPPLWWDDNIDDPPHPEPSPELLAGIERVPVCKNGHTRNIKNTMLRHGILECIDCRRLRDSRRNAKRKEERRHGPVHSPPN